MFSTPIRFAAEIVVLISAALQEATASATAIVAACVARLIPHPDFALWPICGMYLVPGRVENAISLAIICVPAAGSFRRRQACEGE